MGTSASKDTVNRMKSQDTDWKKIFANYISDKELVSKNINNSQNSIKQLNKKNGEIFSWTFNKGRYVDGK